jgi:hypothetical protein
MSRSDDFHGGEPSPEDEPTAPRASEAPQEKVNEAEDTERPPADYPPPRSGGFVPTPLPPPPRAPNDGVEWTPRRGGPVIPEGVVRLEGGKRWKAVWVQREPVTGEFMGATCFPFQGEDMPNPPTEYVPRAAYDELLKTKLHPEALELLYKAERAADAARVLLRDLVAGGRSGVSHLPAIEAAERWLKDNDL